MFIVHTSLPLRRPLLQYCGAKNAPFLFLQLLCQTPLCSNKIAPPRSPDGCSDLPCETRVSLFVTAVTYALKVMTVTGMVIRGRFYRSDDPTNSVIALKDNG